jgi:hypothetical protein
VDHTGRQSATLASGERSSSARTRADVEIAPATLLVIVAIAAGVVAQGGFHTAGRWLIGVPVALAGSGVVRARPRRSRITATVVASACLALWIAMRGAAAGSMVAAGSRIGLLALVAVVVVACRGGTDGDRGALATAVVAVGVATALTGWFGVAFHQEPWAVTGGSTWRAASTLTYPNAAAAAIVIAWLLHLGMRCAARRPRAGSAALSAVLVAGAVATQSRAGAIACAVGLVAITMLLGLRRVAGAVVGPCAGAVVAVVGLVPGLDADASRSPMVALVALAAIALGAGAAEVMDRVVASPRSGVRVAARGVLVTAAAGAAAVASTVSLGDRLALVSSDRVGTNAAALDVIASHPLVGVGPGRLVVAFSVNGGLVGTDLVHDEYLQLVAELGLVGGALAAAAALASVRTLVRRRSCTVSPIWAGCTAALAAFAVHSAFDFLWHIPVVVLLAAVLFGLATSDLPDPDPPHTPTITEEPS